MPRDLLAERKTLDSMSELSREPANSPPPDNTSLVPHRESNLMKQERLKQTGIHPFAQLLNVEDLDDCDWLEHAAFDPIEAASREKLEYRLSTCGELCSGLFTSAYPTSSGPLGALLKAHPTFPSIDSSDSDRKRILLAHIIATKSSSPLVTDDAMSYPSDYKSKYQLTPKTGHNEDGKTICIHSMAVHPDFQKKGLGQVLLKAYLQRIKDSEVAKKIALICRERYVPFYEKVGFRNVGPSRVQYGGGGWVDMVLDFEEDYRDEFGNS
ncbi:hypothetical protein NX059_004419 [Plenodomus lindquistii]|nr:hypothetical protein NX059_004419 [Plenodomus lindquistii]